MGARIVFQVTLLVTAGLVALVIVSYPWLWAGLLPQVVSLSGLPLLLTLMLTLFHSPAEPEIHQTISSITTVWITVLRWTVFLPILVLGWKHFALWQLLVIAGVAYYWAYLLARIWPASWLPFWLQTVDEPTMKRWTETIPTSYQLFSLSTVLGAGLRLSSKGIGIVPTLIGYALLSRKPLWATGLASLGAWVCQELWGGPARPYLLSWYNWLLLWLSLLPLFVYILTQFKPLVYRYYNSQLIFDFSTDRDKKDRLTIAQVIMGIAAFSGLLIVLGPRNTAYFLLATLLAFFYTLLAQGSVGILLFPVWVGLALTGALKPIWAVLVAGFGAGMGAAWLIGQRHAQCRSVLVAQGMAQRLALWGILLAAVLCYNWPLIQGGLAQFPSPVSDWLARLAGYQTAPLVPLVFILLISIGILTQRIFYIYLAWGVFLPWSWGTSLLVGSLLSMIPGWMVQKNSSAKGLLVGDLLASLLWLFK